MLAPRDEDARVTCLRTLRAGSRSFALASTMLPSAARTDAATLYAWCRRVDDAVDLVPQGAQGDAVARLRTELACIYAGRAQSDITLAAFQRVVLERQIPVEYPSELLAGMEMDAQGTDYRTTEQLLQYCYRVAGTVGLMMCHVLGVRDDRALVHAAHLGMAMQLTNISRDVLEDWQRGRLYLPAELLRTQLRPGQPLTQSARDACAHATRGLLALAERYYQSGDAGLPALGFSSALSIRTARLVYSDIGRVVERCGHDPVAPRAVVPRWRKALLVARALLAEGRELPRRILRPSPPTLPTTVVQYPDDVPGL